MGRHAAPPVSSPDEQTIRHWLTFERYYDAAVAGQERQLQDAAAVAVADHVLDVGCGCGQTTRTAAASAPAGSAVGVDLVEALVQRAKSRAAEAGLVNAAFHVADAARHPFAPASFDVILSRHGAQFFADPVAAFKRLREALRPGGRLVMVAWAAADRNEWLQLIGNAVCPGSALPDPVGDPGPFAFADPRRPRHALTQAGLVDIDTVGLQEPVWLGQDAPDAFGFVAGLAFVRGLLATCAAAESAAAEDRLRAALAAAESPEGVRLGATAWLITAHRT
jgi:SAM-dependent methyltransferase